MWWWCDDDDDEFSPLLAVPPARKGYWQIYPLESSRCSRTETNFFFSSQRSDFCYSCVLSGRSGAPCGWKERLILSESPVKDLSLCARCVCSTCVFMLRALWLLPHSTVYKDTHTLIFCIILGTVTAVCDRQVISVRQGTAMNSQWCQIGLYTPPPLKKIFFFVHVWFLSIYLKQNIWIVSSMERQTCYSGQTSQALLLQQYVSLFWDLFSLFSLFFGRNKKSFSIPTLLSLCCFALQSLLIV